LIGIYYQEQNSKLVSTEIFPIYLTLLVISKRNNAGEKRDTLYPGGGGIKQL